MEARLAGWMRVTQPGEICVVKDGPCELLANPADVADVLVMNVVHNTPCGRHELHHGRKA
jgi:hypothetical protein